MLSGGLGNQLFQYAAARNLSARLQRPVVIDLHWYRNIPEGSTPRVELLSKLAIVASFADSGGDPASLAPAGGWWDRLRGPVGLLREKRPFHYDARFDDPPASRPLICLQGYWQSFRYLEPVRELLLREVAPHAGLSAHYEAMLREIEASPSVMLHVRRGDYVHSTSAASVHGTVSPTYYARALAALHEKVGPVKAFVFSDDLGWARDHIDAGADAAWVESEAREDAVIDELMLMSRCRHQIIANSSLSWWGAWLNRHPGKTVIAPSRWLAAEPLDTHDLIPPGWLRLPAD